LRHSRYVYALICLTAALSPKAAALTPDIPAEVKTLKGIVLDVKAPLNRKLDELRRTYGIREVTSGGFHFLDKNNDTVLAVETSRHLNPAKTRRVEEFFYRNRQQQLVLHEKVITHGENLAHHDFESRLFQTGIEAYDLDGPGQILKDAAISMGGPVLRVLTTREDTDSVRIKRHQVSIGESQQLEIRDIYHLAENYRTYEYHILEHQVMIHAQGRGFFNWSNWLGTFRIGVRLSPTLLLPEFTYEKAGMEWVTEGTDGNPQRLHYIKLNGFEAFSRELHANLVVPYIERGPIRAINETLGIGWLWPESQSMQTLGAESKFLNELIVIRNEVNQAKTNPAILSFVETKLNVIIKDIQEGKLKVNDFR